MSIEKSLNKFDDYYHHFLLGIASVLLITPISSLANPISSPATPETVPSKTADKAKKTLQNAVIVRKLDSEKVQRGKIVYQTNCANCHGQNGESKPGWRKKGPDGK